METQIMHWDYERITKIVQRRIDFLMRGAEKETDESLRNTYMDWAFGALMMWESVTRGCAESRSDYSKMLDRIHLINEEPSCKLLLKIY